MRTSFLLVKLYRWYLQEPSQNFEQAAPSAFAPGLDTLLLNSFFMTPGQFVVYSPLFILQYN